LFRAQLPHTTEDISRTFVTIMMNGLKGSPLKGQARVPGKNRKTEKGKTRKR
jgi:hypothetical protein